MIITDDNATLVRRQERKQLLVLLAIVATPLLWVYLHNTYAVKQPGSLILLKNGLPDTDASLVGFSKLTDEVKADENGRMEPLPIGDGQELTFTLDYSDGSMMVTIAGGETVTINRLTRPGMSGAITHTTRTKKWLGLFLNTQTYESFTYSDEDFEAARKGEVSMAQLEAKLWEEYRNAATGQQADPAAD